MQEDKELHSDKINTTVNDHELVFKGAFDFIQNNAQYSEEHFQIYKSNKDGSSTFKIEQLTRLETGEFLKIYTFYKVTKDYTPILVVTDKYIGKIHVQERYIPSMKGTNLIYEFINEKGKNTAETPTPPKYQIATPHAATAFLFLSSKKYDATGRNFYNVLMTENTWNYTAPPMMKYVMMDRVSTTPVEIKVKDKIVKATHYKVFAHGDNIKIKETPMNVYISKNFNIPYQIQAIDQIKINIRYLQEVDRANYEEAFSR